MYVGKGACEFVYKCMWRPEDNFRYGFSGTAHFFFIFIYVCVCMRVCLCVYVCMHVETWSLYVALANLELTMWIKLATNTQRST